MNRYQRLQYGSMTFYRCRCDETQEEQIFSTTRKAKIWSQKVVDTLGHQLTFTLVRVHESETKYSLDTFERESFVLAGKKL